MNQSEYDAFLADACRVAGALSRYGLENLQEVDTAAELRMEIGGEYDEFSAAARRLLPPGGGGRPSGLCPAPLEEEENCLADRVFDVMQSYPALAEYAGLGQERSLSSPPFQLHSDFLEKNPDFLLKLEAAGEDSRKIADEYRQAFGQA